MEKTILTKQCKHCNSSFEITNKDLEFYEKISPIFGGKKYLIPIPTLCPDCRQQRRFSFRNERSLYKRKCDITGKEIISTYSPDKIYKVYDQEYWWSDKWNPTDYGKDFNFSKSFFEQMDELIKDVPQIGLLTMNNENSNYVNFSGNVKNCYLIFASSQNEDCMYCRWIINSKQLVDSSNCSKCENCYECVDCISTNSSKYCLGCVDSYSCYCSYDLIGCNYCIGCHLLRNKSYCINNIQYTKEKYLEIFSTIMINKELLETTIKNGIHRSKYSLNSENCLGEYIINSKNIHHGYEVENSEDCKFISNTYNLKNSQDIDFQAFGDSLCYESIGFENTHNLLFTFGAVHSNNLLYSYLCLSGNSNLFGCVGLKNKSYCVLNKQYTKEEYEKLVPEIIEHMMKPHPNPLLQERGQATIEWGEFFPSSISPYGYNETVAMEYYPVNSTMPSFNWSTYQVHIPKVSKTIKAKKIPSSIKEIPDDVLNWAIECEITKKPFRITKQELEYYRKNNLSLPKIHPDQRHLDRMKLRNPRKIWNRNCDKCGINIKTTYSPDREEIVYCEKCYKKEVY